MDPEIDFVFKIVLIGDSEVGKVIIVNIKVYTYFKI